jgi:hypothetical protein
MPHPVPNSIKCAVVLRGKLADGQMPSHIIHPVSTSSEDKLALVFEKLSVPNAGTAT